MKNLLIVWFIALLLFVTITLFYSSGATSFHGIAESREMIINFKDAVEIKDIYVVEGQVVNNNDLLIKLDQSSILDKIDKIKKQLNKLREQKQANNSFKSSQQKELNKLKQKKLAAIYSEIKKLKTQLEKNNQLTAQLKSISPKEKQALKQKNPLQQRIDTLEKELRIVESSTDINDLIHNNTSKLSSNNNRLQELALMDQLASLQADMNKFNIRSKIDGVIGSINFKKGEKVSPFTPILTLNSKSPSFIKGYIHENTYQQITVGQTVFIRTLNSVPLDTHIKGEVVGVGARIVKFPSRLRKIKDLQIWGREITIKIPEKNPLLLGEKVIISTESKTTFHEFLGL